MTVPVDLLHKLNEFGHAHVLTGWERLPPIEQDAFAAQLRAIDFVELRELTESARQMATTAEQKIEPLPVASDEATVQERRIGEDALRRGGVAALIVAGGQGSRLGFDKPKGMYPVGPVSGATLFQLHAEKLLALSRRYGKPVPFLVMTSPATDADTRSYFEENQFFGLDPLSVIFFQQGTMPAVCLKTGRLMLESPGHLFLSPNGHGGTLTALAECGLLDRLKALGVKHVYYFQVDNPLLKLCEPSFVGRHIAARSEASSKVVFKDRPEEKVGVFAVVNGRCGLIEYSDLPPEMSRAQEPDGTLRFRAGNPAIHLFAVDFLERVTRTGGLPYHVAKKAVAHFDPETGNVVDPGTELNALKFERFIFDALPLAEHWLAVQTHREAEFAPLKNATGPDSPETARAAQIALHSSWLEAAGIKTNGNVVEVSPLFALDAEEVRMKIPTGFAVTGPTHLR